MNEEEKRDIILKKIEVLKKIKRKKYELKQKYSQPTEKSEEIKTPADEEDFWDKAINAAQYAIKGLDYLGGVTRAGIFGSEEDIKSAADITSKEIAPSTSEYLEKKGILKDSPWIRGAVGFAGDVLLDPTTYATLGLSALSKAGKLGKIGLQKSVGKSGIRAYRTALTPATAAVEKGGKKLYKSAFKRVDEAAKYKKAKQALPPSEVMWKYRVTGSRDVMADKTDEVLDKLFTYRKALDEKASKLGARVSSYDALENAKNVVDDFGRIGKQPYYNKAAKKLAKTLDEWEPYFKQNPVLRIEDAQKIKSNMASSVSPALFSKEVAPIEARTFRDAIRTMDKGFKDQIIKQANKVSRQRNYRVNGRLLGDEIKRVEKEMHSLLVGRKSLRQLSKADAQREIFNTTESILASMAITGYPYPFITKKFSDFMRRQGSRVGAQAHKLGKLGTADIGARRMGINMFGQKEPPPFNIYDYESPYSKTAPMQDWKNQAGGVTSRKY